MSADSFPPRVLRLPVVGVMASGTTAHARKARQVGQWLAAEGVHLLTGGGGGTMAAVCAAFAETPDRRGRVIGVLPCRPGDPTRPRAGYPNPWVEIPVYTHLPFSGDRGADDRSRNPINVLSSDVVIALPGGAGTSSEVRLAVAFDRPVIAFLDRRTDLPDLPDGVPDTSDLAVVQDFVRRHLPVRPFVHPSGSP